MSALEHRRSGRSFSNRPLDLRLLSDLLWAVAGVNRKETQGRTAPTARDKKDLDVYVVLADGVYLYDAVSHALNPVVGGDHRAQAGLQPFVADAPLNLVYVSDFAKNCGETDQDKLLYAGAHAGFASQNAYLFAAAFGLATVVRASVDKKALGEILRLRPDQMIVLAQTVGYPGPEKSAE